MKVWVFSNGTTFILGMIKMCDLAQRLLRGETQSHYTVSLPFCIREAKILNKSQSTSSQFHIGTRYFYYAIFFSGISQLIWSLTNQIYFSEFIVNLPTLLYAFLPNIIREVPNT
jgi:hypothetical protein